MLRAYNTYMHTISEKEIAAILKNGGIGVLPTDTLYGLVGSALSKKAVERIYRARKRNPKKPLIILIRSFRDLAAFGITLDAGKKKTLNVVWPGKVSVMLPCPRKRFAYLHRGTHVLAFRMPRDSVLMRLLKKTGPLVAPSANVEGMPPAQTAAAARKYFGGTIDFYIGGGRRAGKPSTLISLNKDGSFVIHRQGAVTIKGAVV